MVTLVLDFDGTIVEGFSWEEARKFYGIPSDMVEKYMRGEVDIKTWSNRDFAEIMKRFREEDLPEIMASLPVKRGFDDFAIKYFPRFKSVSILSGGLPQIVRSFAEKYGIGVHGVEFEGNLITRHIDGKAKHEILENRYAGERVLYVVDEAPGFEGYELEDYGSNVLKVQMGPNGEGDLAANDFLELGKLVDRILAEPEKFFQKPV